MTQELSVKIEKAVEQGLENKILKFIDDIVLEKKLNPLLLEKLNSYGNTPIAEPKKYEAMQKGKVELARLLLTDEEIKTIYTSVEVGDFLYAVEQQIGNMQEKDGSFKATLNTENCNLPNFIEADEILKDSEKQSQLNQKYLKDKKNKELIKQLEDSVAVSEKKAFEISGLNIEPLTDWEKELVKMQVFYSAINARLSSVGKSLGNL